MKLPQFTIPDLPWSTALIAIGMTAIILVLRLRPQFVWLHVAAWYPGGGFIGAGLLLPLRRTWLGAVLGVVAQTIIIWFIPGTP